MRDESCLLSTREDRGGRIRGSEGLGWKEGEREKGKGKRDEESASGREI